MQWKIYYADGSMRTSDEGNPASVPNRYGVACIQQLEPMLNREILNRWELYRFEPSSGLWFGTTDEGVFDRLLARKPIPTLVAGVRISRADFASIYAVALNDPDFAALRKFYDDWESPRYTDESTL